MQMEICERCWKYDIHVGHDHEHSLASKMSWSFKNRGKHDIYIFVFNYVGNRLTYKIYNKY